MRGRVKPGSDDVKLGGLDTLIPSTDVTLLDKLARARRLIICACGTSWHAALVGEYLLEALTGIPVEVEYASEFRYRDLILRKDEVC
jgi:glutamine---fructose-6-phosphate transaminase (isomerizing)